MSARGYFIDAAGFDWPRLLATWAWLLPEGIVPWGMNWYGDLFLIFPAGTVHVLDVGVGALTEVARDQQDFGTQLDTEEHANQWLMIPLVDLVRSAGLVPGPGECYGFKRPPVLGGEYTVENTAVLPLAEQFGFLGELHEQLRDVPDGGSVELNSEDD